MLKTVKYYNEVSADDRYQCAEKLPGCEVTASFHVCFEDGSGVNVCRSCFDKRVNAGEWITDSVEVLAS